ncbi:unnamed protein product [Blepharisma stoltei]|uniref:USP domain-containing protein n=1 Tax=Blepharisma stoltei TaxID=1481888 RepID=A0AAU9IHQ8_9CILI|nr:unnamed protein product [Blepharisma stoltei]
MVFGLLRVVSGRLLKGPADNILKLAYFSLWFSLTIALIVYKKAFPNSKNIKQRQQDKEKSITSRIVDVSKNNKFFEVFNLYQITTCAKIAENLKNESINRFEITSFSPILLGKPGTNAIVRAENRNWYDKIKNDKIPVFIGWEVEKEALDCFKTQILLRNKPGIIILFYKNNEAAIKEEQNLLWITSNLDSECNDIEIEFNKIIEIAINWAESRNYQLEQKLLQGLPNIGNTCYMNSLIQVFSIMPELYEIISSINLPLFQPLKNILLALKMRNDNFNYRYYLEKFQTQIIENFHMVGIIYLVYSP